MRAVLLVGILAAIAGCGGGHDNPQADAPPGTPDAPPGPPDAPPGPPDASTSCTSIDSCGWLTEYEQEIVGKLAGQREIAPGVTLTARASNAQRTTTRDFLVAELTALGYTPTVQAYAANAGNVIATLAPTTGTGNTIVVCAHFDGVPAGPGAADNATGTAVVLAAARYLATVPDRSHPIVFALFDQEEIGLVGSEHFAQQLVTDGTAVDAVHNFDMISWDNDNDTAIELWSPSPALLTLYQNEGSARGIPIEPVTFGFSDHQSFLDHGFTAVGVSEEYVSGDHTPHYHEATDTYAQIKWTYLALATRLGVTIIANSATD